METQTQSTQEIIASQTGLSVGDQALYCFDQAYVWMENTLQTDQYGLEMLPLQPGFWPWWRTHWEAIDKAFLSSRIHMSGREFIQLPGQNQYKMITTPLQLVDIWELYHDTSYVRGNRDLLEKIFHRYIKETVASSK